MSDRRLHPFAFDIAHADGRVERLTWYAPDLATASRYARKWTAARGARLIAEVAQ